MGTKNEPGKYDCYAAAEPDEPVFVLRGSDPLAHMLVALWASAREINGPASPRQEPPEQVAAREREKVAEARACSARMRDWAQSKRGSEAMARAFSALDRAVETAGVDW